MGTGERFMKIRKFFVSFIPKHVSNRTLLNIYHALTLFKVPSRIREKNYAVNCKQLNCEKWNIWKNSSAYIENQNEWKNIRFGMGLHHNMSYSGCEVIASYNAWKALKGSGTPEQMAKLILDYETYGAALWGEFGTSPYAIAKYFKKKGFSVAAAHGNDYTAVDVIVNKYKVMIATVYNDRNDITKQVHTVCITVDSNKRYILHNAYITNKSGAYVESVPYAALTDAIRHISRYEPKLIYLIGIKEG